MFEFYQLIFIVIIFVIASPTIAYLHERNRTNEIKRLPYLGYGFLLAMTSLILDEVFNDDTVDAGSYFYLLLCFPLLTIGLVLSIRRLKNMGKNSLLFLLNFVPLLNMVFELVLLFHPSKKVIPPLIIQNPDVKEAE